MTKDGSNFAGIQGSINGKDFLEILQLDPSIQHEIKYIFITKPTFSKYIEMAKYTKIYSRFPSLVKRDGKTHVIYLSKGEVDFRVNMKKIVKSK